MKKMILAGNLLAALFLASCEQDKSFIKNSSSVDSLSASEQFNVTPSVEGIDTSDITTLKFYVQAKGTYACQNNSLYGSIRDYNDTTIIECAGWYHPSDDSCSGGSNRPSGIFLTHMAQTANFKVFNVKLHGTTYRGSIARNGNSFTMNWPDTSKVTISPLTFTR